jgi:hypothetical protein
MLLITKAIVLERMPDSIRPEAYRVLDPANTKEDIPEFMSKLLKVYHTHKPDDATTEVQEVDAEDEVEAIGRGQKNGKNFNGKNGYNKQKGSNRNNGNRGNGNSNGNYSNGNGKWKSNNGNNYNNGNGYGNGGNNGYRGKRQVIYCWNCKLWGFHVARDCKRNPRDIKEVQMADVKPPMSEIFDPEYNHKRDEFESNEVVSVEELRATLDARKVHEIPLQFAQRRSDRGFL